MKYILLFALIVVIMQVAKGISQQYRERYALFESLGEFFRQMKLNLSFQKQKIKEILEHARLKRVNKEIYITYLNYLENNQNIDLSFVKILDDTEQEQISGMLFSLGKNDTTGEIKQLEAYEAYLNGQIEKARIDKEKYCPLITKLSLLFAIGVAILLI